MTQVVDGDGLNDIYGILFGDEWQQRIADINMVVIYGDAVNEYIDKAFCGIKLMPFKKLFSFKKQGLYFFRINGWSCRTAFLYSNFLGQGLLLGIQII